MIDIREAPQIDESNYLEVDPRGLTKTFSHPGFKPVLEYLWNVSKALRTAEREGALPKLQSVQSFYLEALKWLSGQQATNNWISLSPLNINNASWPTDLDSFMNTYLPNLRNTLNGNALFSIYYEKLNVSSRRDDVTASVLQEVEVKKAEVLGIIEGEAQTKLNAIAAAAALENWQTYFEQLIAPSDGKLSFLERMKDDGKSYLRQMKHYKVWKNAWLFSFVAFQAAFVFLYLNVWHWVPKEHIVELITVKIIIGLLFGSLYVSANKNYRIYANLYDQAKFRSTVAKTVQGIILDDTRILPEHKAILLTVAAQSLFEMRPNGHLTKKESASPLNELVTALVASNKS